MLTASVAAGESGLVITLAGEADHTTAGQLSALSGKKPPEWWHPAHTHDAAHVWLRETAVRARAYS
jgi:hypothetical protein